MAAPAGNCFHDFKGKSMGLGWTRKTGTDNYINIRMLGQTFEMLGQILWWTFIDPVCPSQI